MDIILAPWGDPKNWKIVNYMYNDKSSISFSSSLALADILNIPDENIIIILSSTLVDKKVDNYNELVERVKEIVQDSMEKRDAAVKAFESTIKPKLWVMPGIGTFGTDKRFVHSGSIDLYYNSVYYHTLKLLADIDEDINLHIDLTHGINYMPVLARDAIKLAASTFASTTGRDVNISIYNSDPLYPFPKTDDPNLTLYINNIATLKYNGFKSLQPLLMKLVLNYNYNIYAWKRIASNNDVDVKYIYKGAKATAMGLLLVAGSIMERLKEYYREISRTLNNLSALELECTEKQDSIVIEYKTKLKRETSLLHAITKSLTSIDIDNEVELSVLKNLNTQYYKNVIEPIYNIVANEINCIEQIKDKVKANYKLYAEIKYGIDFDPSKTCKPNQRNLYAHAGFEENAIYLKKEDKVYLSYRDCLDAVLENI